MHILHSLFSNGIGGTERHLAELASAQAAAGHRVTVVLRAERHPSEGVDTLQEWLSPKIKVVYAPRRWPLLHLMWLLHQLQPDVIHTHHRRDSRYMGLAARGKIPIVATLHMSFRAKDYERHHGLICVAPWQLADIPIRENRQRVVIPNWVAPTATISDVERFMLRTHAGVSSQYPQLVGAVGRLTPEKGMEDLVEAFIQVNPPHIKLCIFGEGECRPAIEKKIAAANMQERIVLMGFEPDIRRWYAAFDGMIMPSRYETFGLVLLEAMSVGLPILATRTRGALDVLGENHDVVFAMANEPADLAAAITRFLPRIGKPCDYPELEQYFPERAFERVMELYQKVQFSQQKHSAQEVLQLLLPPREEVIPLRHDGTDSLRGERRIPTPSPKAVAYS
jgi:glycosyltransferase involved in cell wall biosynthesis